MSQQKKLERVLDLLLSEDSENAAELLHQIIVEKARLIYENIVDEEIEEDSMEENDELDEADEVGGEPNKDFTKEISTDKDDIDSDEENDGEPSDDDDGESDDDSHGDLEALEDRVDDLESQLEDLRAEYAEIMGGDEEDTDSSDDESFASLGGGFESPEEEEESVVYEKKKSAKLEVAKQTKKEPKGKRADEETQFLQKVADTGQRGTAKLVGAGTHSKLGAEQDKSTFTNPPSKRDYGGKPVDFGKGTGGEYGKYHGDNAADETPSDNIDEQPKKSAHKADTTAKYTGGKVAGDGGSKSPFTKKPGGHV